MMFRARQRFLWPWLVMTLRVICIWLLIALSSSKEDVQQLLESLSQSLQQYQQQQQQQSHQSHKATSASGTHFSAVRRHQLRQTAVWDHYGQNHSHVADTYLYQPIVTKPAPPDRATSLFEAYPPFPPSRRLANLRKLRNMFVHAYDSYMIHAWPAAELKPLSCEGGRFNLIPLAGVTLIDTLDALVLMGNYTEFARATERLRALDKERSLFNVDENVSLFETTIRVLGGLLSAHQLAESFVQKQVLYSDVFADDQSILWGDEHEDGLDEHDKMCAFGEVTESGEVSVQGQECVATKKVINTTKASTFWRYDGFLLALANDLGRRLIPAFGTDTGIPFGTVNLRRGIPKGETTVASLAGAGTLSLEFELLSRLTGDESFGKAAKLSSRALWMRRSKTHDLNLFGKHIDVRFGSWTETLSGIGSNSDSFLEYLSKHYFLYPDDEDFWVLFLIAYSGVFENSREGEWYVDTDMNAGSKTGRSKHVLESLMAFYPGMQILLGETTPAARTLNSFFIVREFLGFLPERFNFGNWNLDSGRGNAGIHPLRPELLESNYFLHRANRGIGGNESGWLWAADFSLHKIEQVSRTNCGYAIVHSVSPETTGSVDGSMNPLKVQLENEMPSFFLSETLKYLYLTYDEENVLHQDDDHDWIFTTEAHPIHSHPKRAKGHAKEQDVRTLQAMLRNRIQMKTPSPPGHQNYLGHEKWTEQTTHVGFHTDAYESREKMVRERSRDEIGGFFRERNLQGGFSNGESTMDVFSETIYAKNVAHVAMKNTGSGTGKLMRKACPNLYASELMWMHALNGGSADYVESHISVGSDSLSDHPLSSVPIGAADALGIHGLGLHPTTDKHNATCPLKREDNTRRKPHRSPSRSHTKHESPNEPPRMNIGDFELTTFADGGGFSISRKSTGDRIITNFLFDEVDLSKAYTMVYAGYSLDPSSPSAHETVSGNSIWPLRRKEEEHSNEEVSPSFRRNVVMGDFLGNSFLCEVQVYALDEDALEKNLTRVPCAPGFFGPTDIRHLVVSGDIHVDAVLQGPPSGDNVGCRGPERTDVALEDESIRVVHRGDCTFVDKATNMQGRFGARALIVINSEADELFSMSGTDPDDPKVPDKAMAGTVLVTGKDGADILSILDHQTEERTVMARISLTRQQVKFAESDAEILVAANDLGWPVVQCRQRSLKIFALGGWGVSATYTEAKGHGEWHLQLLQFQG